MPGRRGGSSADLSLWLRGSIVSGYKVGRKLGFPTANIQVDEPFKIIPGIGVYAVRVYLNEQRYKGMLYIGNRPTWTTVTTSHWK